MSDKTGWKGRGQHCGTRIGPDGTVSGALGPGERKYLCAGVPKGYIVSGWELKRNFRLKGNTSVSYGN